MNDIGVSQHVLSQICMLAKQHSIQKVILFGSRARGTYRRESDIDLATSGGNPELYHDALENETDTLLQFDVINLDRTVKKELFEAIRNEGICIYEKV